MGIEDFIGVWKCQSGNIIEIKANTEISLKVNFISGKTGQPVSRPYFDNMESIDMKAEMDFYETGIEVELWKKGNGFHLSLLRDQIYINNGDNEFYLAPGITRYENDTSIDTYINLFGPLEYYRKIREPLCKNNIP